MEIDVVIEIPKGSRNKYEADAEGRIWLDRTLFTSTQYPEDYGHVHGTLAEDGDPLDAMVVLRQPTFPGCHIVARPIGMFRMSDEAGPDTKLLCVPARDPRCAGITDLTDVSPHELDEIAHFFAIYKALEPGKSVEAEGWGGREEAEAMVEECRARLSAAR